MTAPGRAAAGEAAVPPAPGGGGPEAVLVTRSRRTTLWAALGALVIVVILGYLPYLVLSGTTDFLVNVFVLMTMASMWNLLAGYAGLVSVGQQAFVGLGGYLVLILSNHAVEPFLALPVAVAGCAVVGLPVWWLVSRLRTGYFAIATWVIASIFELIVVRFPSLGGGTGANLSGFENLDPTLLTAYTYWAALAVVVLVVLFVYLILRSRLGLVLTAMRDDETGARSSGVRVPRTQGFVFVVAAAGCGAAGAIVIISQLSIEPTAAFSVQYSAEMIFATIIGGIGTIEGPILGTIIFFALQRSLAQYGTWYFIVLGLVAMAVALWAPRGIWGLISERFGIRLFPVGYHLWPAGEQRPRGLAALRRRSSGTAPLAGAAGPAEASRAPDDGPAPPPG